MKNIFLRLMFALMVGATFTACTTDYYEEEIYSNETHFTPPTWIQGKWSLVQNNQTYMYEFTADDMILKVQNETQSYNAKINLANYDIEENVIVVEEISDSTRYKFRIESLNGIESFDFVKRSENEMVDEDNQFYNQFVRFLE